MSRVKILMPGTFHFSTTIPVRITDINYGGHVGNDSILSIIHEARMQFLRQYNYTELDFAGVGMIMSDVAIEFKNELFYGDTIKASIAIAEISKVSFALYYKFENVAENKSTLIALARTGMVCYHYGNKKIAAVPDEIKVQFTN